MDILTFKVKAIIGAIVAVALAVMVLWYGEWRADARGAQVTQKYEAALLKQKVEAAKRLADEVAYSQRVERALGDAQRSIEEMGHERETISAGYEKRLAAAAAAGGGRLRDPNATGCRGGGGGAAAADPAPAGARAQDGAEAGGLLSAQLTGLLQRLQSEADAINDAYAVCKPDAVNLRRQLSPSP